MDKGLKDFILNSFDRMQNYEKKGRYFHCLTPDDNSPTVVHKNTNQLTYVLSGSGIVFLNGKPQQIEKDSALFIQVGTTHRFIAITDELFLFHIHIPDEGRENDRYIIDGEDYKRNG